MRNILPYPRPLKKCLVTVAIYSRRVYTVLRSVVQGVSEQACWAVLSVEE